MRRRLEEYVGDASVLYKRHERRAYTVLCYIKLNELEKKIEKGTIHCISTNMHGSSYVLTFLVRSA